MSDSPYSHRASHPIDVQHQLGSNSGSGLPPHRHQLDSDLPVLRRTHPVDVQRQSDSNSGSQAGRPPHRHQLDILVLRRHALVGNVIFTDACWDPTLTPNGISLLLRGIPSVVDTAQPTSSSISNIWQFNWIRNEFPYMMLVPIHTPFTGSLFRRLNYTRDFPLEKQSSGGWALASSVICEWTSLERNLRALLAAMHLLCLYQPFIPPLFQYWPAPYRYGYEGTYRTRKQAQIVATNSRNAFIPLMTAITYFWLILECIDGSEGIDWRAKVLKRTGIHCEWLAELEFSAAGDFTSTPRVGGILDMDSCKFQSILPFLWRCQVRMPLLLHWGNIIDRPFPVDDFILHQELTPDRTEIARLRSSTLPAPLEFEPDPPNVPSQSDSPVHDPPPRAFPAVEKSSGQREGQNWRDFFARRAQENTLQAAQETAQERESRGQREAVAAKHMPPGRNGARVYYWDDVDGFWIRKAAGRRFYSAIWGDYAPAQRRYDSFCNEWDLCPALAPNAEPDGDGDGDDGFDFYGEPVLPPSLLPEDDPSHLPNNNEGPYSSTADLQRIHGTRNVEHSVVEFAGTLDALAYSHFGFMEPITPLRDPRYRMDWVTIVKLLACHWQSFPPASERVRDAMAIFFGYLISVKSAADMPPEYLDLLRSDSPVHRQTVNIRRETLGSKDYYILSPKFAADPPFELAVTSPALVVEILRDQWGPDLSAIAHQLLIRGIAFNTFIRGSARPQTPEMLVARFSGLGYRPKGYKPDQIDYLAYERRRDRLLSSPRGRAALLMGGIVARLARDLVNFEHVSRGPSEDVFHDGTVVWNEQTPSLGYWDDRLTADEVNMICGVYKVDTGELLLL
jgi:hypothetical protein